MNDILKEFIAKKEPSGYIFGQVLRIITYGVYLIKTDIGVNVTINETINTYVVGDQVIMTARENNLNSLVILRKVDKSTPTISSSIIVTNDQN